MTDITTYPLEDWFETTLSQDRDGAVGTIYVNTTPSFTFPAGVTTYIIVDPGKSNMQLAEISAYSSSLNTITVSSISTNKGANVAYTQQAHRIGAVVRISHNYQFWKDIVDSLNSKIDTNNDDIAMGKFADTTARDAYFTSPVEGNSAYITGVGRYDYTSWSWVLRAANTWAAAVLLTGNQTVWWVKTFDDWLIADWLTSNNDVEVRWQDILHTGRYAWLTNRALGRAVETKNNANDWGVRFAEYVDADNALVWNRRYAIWWYPIKTDGSWYWTSKEMFYLDFPTYDGNVTFTTSGKFMVDNLYLNDKNIYGAASDAEAITGTATNRVITAKQLKDRSFNDFLMVSENLKSSADTQVLANPWSTRTKYKEIRISCFGAVRVKFEVRWRDQSGYGSTRCQVYINWSAVGVELTWPTPLVRETALSQDFTVKANDLVQLYMNTWNTDWWNWWLRNFRVYYDVTKIENSTVIQN